MIAAAAYIHGTRPDPESAIYLTRTPLVISEGHKAILTFTPTHDGLHRFMLCYTETPAFIAPITASLSWSLRSATGDVGGGPCDSRRSWQLGPYRPRRILAEFDAVAHMQYTATLTVDSARHRAAGQEYLAEVGYTGASTTPLIRQRRLMNRGSCMLVALAVLLQFLPCTRLLISNGIHRARTKRGLCPRCRYPRSDHPRCPECGLRHAPSSVDQPPHHVRCTSECDRPGADAHETANS